MKLLIDQDMVFTWNAPADLSAVDLALELEYYRRLERIAKRYALSSKFTFGPIGAEVLVLAQKVTLGEVAMNALFADFLTELFLIETRYASLGGAGCDFALTVVNAVPCPTWSSLALE